MRTTTWAWVGTMVLTLVVTVGCSGQPGQGLIEAPPAPVMPADWEVTSDMCFPPHEVKRVGRNLGGGLTSLRNTVYEVNGKRVQLNTIEAVDSTAADRIMLRLRDMKPDEFLLQRGSIVYEFVCDNDAIPEALAGVEHLEGNL